jgi:uncharacterized protein (DUF433 family)
VSETLAIHADPPAIRADENGTLRIGESRVSLDVLVEQYDNGMSAEEMVVAYDTLTLADAYAAIAYYLRHGDDVRSYLQRRAGEAAEMRARIEKAHPRVTREDLRMRQVAAENDHAPNGQ